MYKLLSITQYTRTRDVILKNLATGTIDSCFDDAMVQSPDNFNFMQVGNDYDCRIVLFGGTKRANVGEWHRYIIEATDVPIGDRTFVKVRKRTDFYYVYQDDVIPYLAAGNFMFESTRKDLVQVGDVVHAGLLD